MVFSKKFQWGMFRLCAVASWDSGGPPEIFHFVASLAALCCYLSISGGVPIRFLLSAFPNLEFFDGFYFYYGMGLKLKWHATWAYLDQSLDCLPVKAMKEVTPFLFFFKLGFKMHILIFSGFSSGIFLHK